MMSTMGSLPQPIYNDDDDWYTLASGSMGLTSPVVSPPSTRAKYKERIERKLKVVNDESFMAERALMDDCISDRSVSSWDQLGEKLLEKSGNEKSVKRVEKQLQKENEIESNEDSVMGSPEKKHVRFNDNVQFYKTYP